MNSDTVAEYTDIIQRHGIKPEYVLEIGSREGFHADYIRERLGVDKDNVYVVEPSTYFQKIIKEEYPKFNIVNKAFHNYTGKANFNQVNSGGLDVMGTSSILDRDNWYGSNTSKETVDTITGYDFIEQTDLKNFALKIDVEGLTYEVLEGFGSHIDRIDSLHIETEEYRVWKGQKTNKDVYELLTSKNFVLVYQKRLNEDMPGLIQYDQVWIKKSLIKKGINTYFDKIFYINMNKDIDRDIHIRDEFAKVGITNYERISGVKIDSIPEHNLWRNFNRERLSEKYILGSLGARSSHVRVMKEALRRGYSKIMILEDDISFVFNPDDVLDKNMKSLPSWDMIYFGGTVEHHMRGQIVGAYAYAVNQTIMSEVVSMAEASGMEIDNFYAKYLYHASCNYRPNGRYIIQPLYPFESITHKYLFPTNIQK